MAKLAYCRPALKLHCALHPGRQFADSHKPAAQGCRSKCQALGAQAAIARSYCSQLYRLSQYAAAQHHLCNVRPARFHSMQKSAPTRIQGHSSILASATQVDAAEAQRMCSNSAAAELYLAQAAEPRRQLYHFKAGSLQAHLWLCRTPCSWELVNSCKTDCTLHLGRS